MVECADCCDNAPLGRMLREAIAFFRKKSDSPSRIHVIFCTCILGFICVAALCGQVTAPLQEAGIPVLWQENFINSCMQRFQFAYAKGRDTTMDSFVIPGAVHMGQKEVSSASGPYVEMEINNFRRSGDEPIAHTLEFDVLPVQNGNIRVSLRPWRMGDMIHLKIGNEKDGTSVAFSYKDGPVVDYRVKTGPSHGWAHVTASYRSFRTSRGISCQMVVAVNEEVHARTGISQLNDNLSSLSTWEEAWDKQSGRLHTDAWDVEIQADTEKKIGRYIANLRGYHEFLDEMEMTTHLTGRVQPYLLSLPDPRDYAGPKKYFRQAGSLDLSGPNMIGYTEAIGGLKVRFDGSLSSSYYELSSFIWDFGDGNTSTLRTDEHTYAVAGTYAASLTVVSAHGTAKTKTIPVTVGDGGHVSQHAVDLAVLIPVLFPMIFIFTAGAS